MSLHPTYTYESVERLTFSGQGGCAPHFQCSGRIPVRDFRSSDRDSLPSRHSGDKGLGAESAPWDTTVLYLHPVGNNGINSDSM
jgi:hypothetical protein